MCSLGKLLRHCCDDFCQSMLQLNMRREWQQYIDPSSRVFYHYARKFEA